MLSLNPKIIRYLERKKRQQLLENVLFLSPGHGILLITFLEFVMSGLYIGLILSYEPQPDDEFFNNESPWMSNYSKFLSSFETWFMFDRTFAILTTGIMVLGYRKSRRSLLLPYIFYILFGVIGNLISLFHTTSFLTATVTVIISFEFSSCLTVCGLWRRLRFRELVTEEHSRFQRLLQIQEDLLEMEGFYNDSLDSDVEDEE
jgi:hypothetical protein